MQSSGNSQRTSGIFLSLFLLLSSSSASEKRFYLTSETHQTRDAGEVTQPFLVTETTLFYFRPPYQWKFTADPSQQTVLFLAPDQSAAVKMQIGSHVSWKNLDELRTEIKSRFEKSEIVAEATVYTAGGIAAPSFDLQWNNALKVPITTRLIFVPIESETVEFSMSTGSDRFGTNSPAVNNIACSFRTEPRLAKE